MEEEKGMNFDETKPGVEVEIGKSFWKFDGPIGRFRFFCILLFYSIGLIAVVFTRGMIVPFLRACPVGMYHFLIIMLLIMFWIMFVAVSKRMYDITGNLMSGIICTLIYCIVVFPIFRAVSFLLLFILVFIPEE